MMLSLQRIQDFSSVETVGGKCWQFDPVANFAGGSFRKRDYGTPCCCVANSSRQSSSDDAFNEFFFKLRVCSIKEKLASSWKCSRNALITSAQSLGVITKDNFLQDSETNFNLVADDGRLQQSLASPLLPRITSPKLLQEPIPKSKSRNNGQVLLEAFLSRNGIEPTRRDFACEIRNGAFAMEDGESYTSFSVGKDGHPIVCNSKGCRPLSESERRSPVYIAHALTSMNGREIDSHTLGKIKQKSAHIEDRFPSAAQKCSERAALWREVHGDTEATDNSFSRDSEAPPHDSVLASYAWLLWNEADEL